MRSHTFFVSTTTLIATKGDRVPVESQESRIWRKDSQEANTQRKQEREALMLFAKGL